MEIRPIQSFVAVAEELSFTKAAQRLGIAQPPVSRHVRDLEEELGVQLFSKCRRGRNFPRQWRMLQKNFDPSTKAQLDIA